MKVRISLGTFTHEELERYTKNENNQINFEDTGSSATAGLPSISFSTYTDKQLERYSKNENGQINSEDTASFATAGLSTPL